MKKFVSFLLMASFVVSGLFAADSYSRDQNEKRVPGMTAPSYIPEETRQRGYSQGETDLEEGGEVTLYIGKVALRGELVQAGTIYGQPQYMLTVQLGSPKEREMTIRQLSAVAPGTSIEMVFDNGQSTKGVLRSKEVVGSNGPVHVSCDFPGWLKGFGLGLGLGIWIGILL